MQKSLLQLFLSIYFVACIINTSKAQTSQWTWVSGDSTFRQFAVTGTQGVAAPANKPGARYDAASFTDAAGNLWLFSGDAVFSDGSDNPIIDLWKFDVKTGWWTFVTGNELSGAFPTVKLRGTGNGTANGTQYSGPGSREGGSAWADATGKVWIFGGLGNNAGVLYGTVGLTTFLNDVWRYDTTAKTWTWLTGDTLAPKPSNYGTKGVPSATNQPACRYRHASWTDASGNLWIFGGSQNDANSSNGINQSSDLWMFNIQTLQWTWMAGDNTLGHAGNYGTQGVPLPSNNPGARFSPAEQKDKLGNFYMFGGRGYDASGVRGPLNDLWRYNTATNMWTWISGSTQNNATGNYGTKGVFASTNVPPARQGAKAWTDTLGNFWIFGGFNPLNGLSYFNDVWEYNVVLQQWAWISGDAVGNTGSIYGTKGTSSPSNKPGARYFSVTWTDASNAFWLMGGLGVNTTGQTADIMNDMWKFGSGNILPVTLMNFNGELKNKTATLNWTVATDINSKGFEVQKSTNAQTFTTVGFVNDAGNALNINTYSFTDTKALDATTYYRLKQVDKDGRFTLSNVIMLNINTDDIVLSPNPVSSLITIQSTSPILNLKCFNAAGNAVLDVSPNTNTYQLNINRFTSGNYFFRIETTNGIINKKIIKQ